MGDPEDLVATLEGTVDRLKVIIKEREGIPLTDDVQEVFHLCETVESILRHQQKEKVNFWGERRDYWHYLTEGLGSIKGLDSCVKIVQALPQLTTAQGKGRALIRECLSEQLLADCLQHSVGNSKRTKEWYHISAVLLLPSLTQRVLSALYDLSEVTFDLTLEGVELDDHWPSFTLKSFGSPVHRSTPDAKTKSPSSGGSLFGGVLGSTQEAKAAGKGKPPRRPLLERAVEEQPTEIFVKHEVPFNIELVGSLLTNIRSNLIGQDFGQSPTHPAPKTAMLPELQVSKLDDITSCLTVLSDYITSWSHDVAKDSRSMKNELRDLKDKVSDLELQLQETIIESETSESSLLERITDSHSNLKSCNSVRFHLNEENESLKQQLAKARARVSELEMMNFDLEEQLVRSDLTSEEAETRQRALTMAEFSLSEKEKEVEELVGQLERERQETEHLRAQLSESQTQLLAKAKVEELHQQSESELKEKSSEIEELLRKQSQLEAQNANLEDKNGQLNAALEELKAEKDQEVEGLKKKLGLESEHRMSLERERDQARKDISSMQGQIELETSSLRFQMSSQTLEVQTAKEAVKKKEKLISDLRSELVEMESRVSEANGRHRKTEEQLEELRQEMKDVESLLQTNQDEMMALHEQLTESNTSRDNQRAEMLKLQNKSDSVQSELKRQVDQLTAENDDIRKAFKKLLEQKVTLWQHADELEQEQVSMGTWIDSKDVADCMACGSNFTAFKRKHHCRSCGKVFCSKCCEQKAQLPVSKDPVRVCDKCHEKIEHVRTPFAAKMINSLDAESLSQTVGGLLPPNGNLPGGSQRGSQRSSRGGSRGGSRGELDTMCNGVSKNSLNIERRSVDLGGNSLHAKLMLQNSDEYSASSTPNLSRLEATLLSQDETLSNRTDNGGTGTGSARGTTFSIDYDAESIRSVSSTDYSVDPEVKQREAVKEQLLLQDVGEDLSIRISTVEGDTTDDSYYIIETNPEASFPVGLDTHGTQHLDVDALASKLASIEVARKSEEEVSPSGNSPDDPLLGFGSPLRSVSKNSQAVATDNLEYKEVMMQGGGVHSVPITIEKYGTAIAWEFNTEPKGLAFGIVYKATSDSSKEDELLPLKRCSSHKAVLTGEYIAQKAGIYILKFDNRHSKYSGRKLMYKIWLKHML